jgi:hypothetical protein
MDQETKEIISKQTGESDLLLIEKIFFECDSDIGATICKLQNIEYKEPKKPKKTEFDDIRKILDEKDTIFQEYLEKNK